MNRNLQRSFIFEQLSNVQIFKRKNLVCTKWSNLEDWFIATISVSMLTVQTVKTSLVQVI